VEVEGGICRQPLAVKSGSWCAARLMSLLSIFTAILDPLERLKARAQARRASLAATPDIQFISAHILPPPRPKQLKEQTTTATMGQENTGGEASPGGQARKDSDIMKPDLCAGAQLRTHPQVEVR
jgi:hypothetical protein